MEIIKKDIFNMLINYYRINPRLFDYQTNLFSYPIYLKARDVLYILYYLSLKYEKRLSLSINNYGIISIDSLAEYLNDCSSK